ncbi:unnamed protein product [Closterium sp. Yama58-4]|nr:unnamed protein product [Closterium sp. Yama58-4]
MDPPRPVWLDCDPGHDDAMAIILAAHTPSLHLLGISTVHGNQSVQKVTINARRVLLMCARPDIPVFCGQASPLMRARQHCAEIHGESGLDGPDWGEGEAQGEGEQGKGKGGDGGGAGRREDREESGGSGERGEREETPLWGTAEEEAEEVAEIERETGGGGAEGRREGEGGRGEGGEGVGEEGDVPTVTHMFRHIRRGFLERQAAIKERKKRAGQSDLNEEQGGGKEKWAGAAGNGSAAVGEGAGSLTNAALLLTVHPQVKSTIEAGSLTNAALLLTVHPQVKSMIEAGSLTNASLLLTVHPQVKSMIEAGSLTNASLLLTVHPQVKSMIECDPEAASIVFNSGCPLTMVPLEVNHTALLYPSVAARISTCPPHCAVCAPSSTHPAVLPTPSTTPSASTAGATQSTDAAATAVAATTADASLTVPAASAGGCLGCYRGKKLRQTVSALMHFFARTYLEVFGFHHPPLHDPCALAFVIAPSLFNTEHLRVDIETKTAVLFKVRDEKYLLDVQHVDGSHMLFPDLSADFLAELHVI